MGSAQQMLLAEGGVVIPTPEVEYDARTQLGADGSTITSWDDSSGHSRTMAITADPTTVETNELNGHQVTRWNGGIGDWSGNSQSNLYTVIAVLKCTSFASSAKTVMSAATGGIEGTVPLVWLSTAGKIEIVQTDVTVLATSNTALNTTNFFTICAQYNSSTGAYQFYLNGSADGSGTATAITFAHFTRIGRRNGNQNPFPGDIAYMALWNSFLSSGELTAIFNSLRTVWANY